MIYQSYQTAMDGLEPFKAMARMTAKMLRQNWLALGLPETQGSSPKSYVAAAMEMISEAGTTHKRPPFDIETVMVGNRPAHITEEATFSTPFGTLLHFAKDIPHKHP